MRSFAIEDPGSPDPPLYATLPPTTCGVQPRKSPSNLYEKHIKSIPLMETRENTLDLVMEVALGLTVVMPPEPTL